MPIYSYKCPKCGARWSNERTVKDRLNERCACGKRAVIVIAPVGRIWHTDKG